MDYRIIDGVMHHVADLIAQQPSNSIGIVTSYDPISGRARVTIQPENQLTGWLPIASASTGTLTMFSPPAIGEQVLVVPQDGDPDNGVIVGHIYSAKSLPPKTAPTFDAEPTLVQQNECLITNGKATLRINADGSIFVVGTRVDVLAPKVNIKGDVTVTGNMHVTGNITTAADVTATGEVTSKGVKLSAHRHTGVQSGLSNTGNPVP